MPTSRHRPQEYVVDGEPVEVRRSARRRRTVSVRRESGRLVAMVPDTLPGGEEKRLVEELARKVLHRDARGHAGDAELEQRAVELSRRYLGGRARPASVRWSARQHRRWGSCTPSTGEIRISEAARPLPPKVFDYVLVHELAHLLEPGHGPEFRGLVEAYPHLGYAEGFLDGASWSHDRGPVTT